MRRISLLVVATAILLLVPTAVFANIGTPAGTVFNNMAELVWNTSGGGIGADTGIDNTYSCSGVYSETYSVTDDDTSLSGDVGETVPFYFLIFNSGNATDSFTIGVAAIVLENGATDWIATLDRDGSETKTYTPTGAVTTFGAVGESVTTTNLAADASESFTVFVQINPLLANAPNLSSCSVAIQARSVSSADSAQYTGLNGNDYAIGGATFSETVICWVMTATVSLTKTGAISSSPLGGLPVPGAVLEYVLEYNNSGAVGTETAVIYDQIPTNTTFYDTDFTSGIKAAVTGDSSTGWEEQYSDLASPSQVVDDGNADWTIDVTNLPGGGTTVADIRWIRWVRRSNVGIAAAENLTLGFRSTID